MTIHVDFHATSAGAAWQTVHCERCNNPYHYALVRRGEATVRAAFGVGQSSAETRAEKTSQYRLMQALEKGVEIVPCPSCGWVQDDMVREARRRTARWLLFLAALCFGAGVCLAIYPLGESLSVADPEVTPAEKNRATVGFLIGLGAAIALLIVRRTIQSTINPNAGHPKRPQPLPGAPLGIPGKAPVLPRGATSHLS